MADSGDQMSKAAKKNLKKKKAKASKRILHVSGGPAGGFSPEDVLAMLKEQLEEAKKNKDHGRAGTLRDQVWVLTDLIAGVRTDIPEDELAPILASISKNTDGLGEELGVSTTTPAQQARPATGSNDMEDRKLRGLRKKLNQIVTLKELQAKGEKLEQNQLDKIAREDQLREEIEEIETMIKEITLSSKR